LTRAVLVKELNCVKDDRSRGTNRLIHVLQKSLTSDSRHSELSSPLKDDEPSIPQSFLGFLRSPSAKSSAKYPELLEPIPDKPTMADKGRNTSLPFPKAMTINSSQDCVALAKCHVGRCEPKVRKTPAPSFACK
jgi:hypothetical protein